MSGTERRDLFGRTEAQLRSAIARQERTLPIVETYRGNEGLALNLARQRANLAIDRRQLAELLGERVANSEPVRLLSGAALDRWREEILRMARTSRA